MSDIENIAKQIVVKGKGILAADESTGTMTKRLSSVNIESTSENVFFVKFELEGRGRDQQSHRGVVAGSLAKSQLFARVSRNQGIRYSDALQPLFFEMFASERRIIRYVRGKPEARFERIKGKRAETLDGTVYALAVRQLIGQRMDLRQSELAIYKYFSRRAKNKRASRLYCCYNKYF